ncbi:MAG: hypothetical protein OEZ25_02585 [Candidatus Bathyarchaeota archaeon]|nr:hypothetical protein [Candidatus Bathyarchaeota archaeon]
MTRILIQKFEKEIKEKFANEVRKKTMRLIGGVDTAPGNAPNAIFYLRTESQYKLGGKKKHEEFWLSLKELEQLGMLLLVSSKFWGERLESGTKYGKKKIRRLKEFWKELLEYWPEPIT